MEYSVPQFIEVEDKIIGPLTLKQFLIMVGFTLVEFFYWSIFDIGLIFIVLTFPTLIFFAALAFGRFNGRPVLASGPDLVKFYLTPRYRIFSRTGQSSPMVKHKLEELSKSPGADLEGESKESRLKKLAYLLDQKSAEEERLIKSGKISDTWLNQI